ncbi:sugar transferase [Dermacoccaceae bacterium W4C1]
MAKVQSDGMAVDPASIEAPSAPGPSRTPRPEWAPSVIRRVAITDAAAIAIAVLVANRLRFGASRAEVTGAGGLTYGSVALILAIGWLLSLIAMQAYRPTIFGVGHDEYRTVFNATFVTFGIVSLFAMLFRVEVARGFLAIALPLGLTLLLLGRLINRRWLVRARARGELADRVVIVGAPQEVRHVAEGIARNTAAGYHVVAVATNDRPDPAFELRDGTLVPQVGAIDGACDMAKRMGARSLVVAGGARVSNDQIRQIGWELEGMGGHLVLASRMTDIAGPRIHWRRIEGLPLMSVELPHYTGPRYAMKRAFDIFFALGSLVLLSPVMLVVALAIKIDSRGPVFFRQTRIGIRGEPFKMTKFRSMVDGADRQQQKLSADGHQGSGLLFKLKDDPRQTKVGKFIRRTSLDELPQLLDVVRGSMSIVGPRPALPLEVDRYADDVRRRLNVRPGITGPWQIGGRSNLSWEDSVRKDLSYVENWSMTSDILIIVKTIRAVLTSDGAY